MTYGTKNYAQETAVVDVPASNVGGNGQSTAKAAVVVAAGSDGNPLGSGGIAVVSGSFSRPADTTAYTINDLVAGSASVAAGNSPAITAVRTLGDALRFEVIRLRKSDKSLTNAQFRVHLFNAQPTWDVGDNAGAGAITALLVANMASHVGYVDITMDRASNTAGAYGVGITATGVKTIQPVDGSNVYFAIQALAAYTPASGETFTVEIEGVRP